MIKRIGNAEIQATHKATCHCGQVILELDLPDGVVDPKRCNCSLCRRRGAVMGSVPLSGLRVLQGEQLLKQYRFNSQQACHFFCAECGVYTHHIRRIDPSQCAYNIGCLEGVNPYDLEAAVPVSDGAHHPQDKL
ncbi:GFA family protein [Pseudomonas sp. NPDC089392]|uniref:GFA family protein n=1 Tax=Pseudomonas sp. NPDC089392 TaxID=3364459 RepID=UPI0037FBE788